MSCDKLVFDLSQEVEGSPSVFVKKDWVNILDNQNGSYSANQSVVDTSQLSNSNKYMSYREAYLQVPMLLTLTSDIGVQKLVPATAASSADYAIGLKNWFGSIVHSFTLDYNGTTIIQQTPFINMWNSFKLMTTLSWGDVATIGSTIGFYPDDPLAWSFQNIASSDGIGTCNNGNSGLTALGSAKTATAFNVYGSSSGNIGFLKRQQYINYDADGVSGTGTYADFITGGSGASASQNLWRSYVLKKVNSTAAVAGVLQISISATIYLKHLHSFFQQTPLLKGVFMKMTLALNNTSCVIAKVGGCDGTLAITSVSNSVGGVNPIMFAATSNDDAVVSATGTGVVATSAIQTLTTIVPNIIPGMIVSGAGISSAALDGVVVVSVSHSASATTYVASQSFTSTASAYIFTAPSYQPLALNGAYGISGLAATLTADLSVGKTSLTTSSVAGVVSASQPSIVMYVPAYTFNPTFESAYLSSPIKKIQYTDVYQYQVQLVGAGQTFNNLLTNGIANIKSVLILPFFSQGTGASQSGISVPVWQSPFDPAGTGPTSPLCLLNNFNIVVSGQNAIYNTQKYSFEQFINQLYGVNAVNGGMTDGLTSALFNSLGFEMEYNYFYVDVSRMLPVEESVPKSVQVMGQNQSTKDITLMCFVEYGCEVDIDILTGARV